MSCDFYQERHLSSRGVQMSPAKHASSMPCQRQAACSCANHRPCCLPVVGPCVERGTSRASRSGYHRRYKQNSKQRQAKHQSDFRSELRGVDWGKVRITGRLTNKGLKSASTSFNSGYNRAASTSTLASSTADFPVICVHSGQSCCMAAWLHARSTCSLPCSLPCPVHCPVPPDTP